MGYWTGSLAVGGTLTWVPPVWPAGVTVVRDRLTVSDEPDTVLANPPLAITHAAGEVARLYAMRETGTDTATGLSRTYTVLAPGPVVAAPASGPTPPAISGIGVLSGYGATARGILYNSTAPDAVVVDLADGNNVFTIARSLTFASDGHLLSVVHPTLGRSNERALPVVAGAAVRAILGQSEDSIGLFLNQTFYTAGPYPTLLPGVDAAVAIRGSDDRSGQASLRALTPAAIAARDINPGAVAYANVWHLGSGGVPLRLVGVTVPGTSMTDLMDDVAGDGRDFADDAALVALAEAAWGPITDASYVWWNAEAGAAKTLWASRSAHFFGINPDGSPYDFTAGPLDHCLIDTTGRGKGLLSTAARVNLALPGIRVDGHDTAISPPMLGYLRNADGSTFSGMRFQNALGAVQARKDFLAASPAAQRGGLGIAPALCRFGDYAGGVQAAGGQTAIHPAMQDPDGQILFAQHLAASDLVAEGHIARPYVDRWERNADATVITMVVRLPAGATLTTIRKQRGMPVPASPRPHQHLDGMGISVLRAADLTASEDTNLRNARPLYRADNTDAALYPVSHRGTVAIANAGTDVGAVREARVTITLAQPLGATERIYWCADGGVGSWNLHGIPDYDARLYLDGLIAHIPALAVGSHPYPGIPVEPQVMVAQSAMTVTGAPANAILIDSDTDSGPTSRATVMARTDLAGKTITFAPGDYTYVESEWSGRDWSAITTFMCRDGARSARIMIPSGPLTSGRRMSSPRNVVWEGLDVYLPWDDATMAATNDTIYGFSLAGTARGTVRFKDCWFHSNALDLNTSNPVVGIRGHRGLLHNDPGFVIEAGALVEYVGCEVEQANRLAILGHKGDGQLRVVGCDLHDFVLDGLFLRYKSPNTEVWFNTFRNPRPNVQTPYPVQSINTATAEFTIAGSVWPQIAVGEALPWNIAPATTTAPGGVSVGPDYSGSIVSRTATSTVVRLTGVTLTSAGSNVWLIPEPGHADAAQQAGDAGNETYINGTSWIGNRTLLYPTPGADYAQIYLHEDVAAAGVPGYYRYTTHGINLGVGGVDHGISLNNPISALMVGNAMLTDDDPSAGPVYARFLSSWSHAGWANASVRNISAAVPVRGATDTVEWTGRDNVQATGGYRALGVWNSAPDATGPVPETMQEIEDHWRRTDLGGVYSYAARTFDVPWLNLVETEAAFAYAPVVDATQNTWITYAPVRVTAIRNSEGNPAVYGAMAHVTGEYGAQLRVTSDAAGTQVIADWGTTPRLVGLQEYVQVRQLTSWITSRDHRNTLFLGRSRAMFEARTEATDRRPVRYLANFALADQSTGMTFGSASAVYDDAGDRYTVTQSAASGHVITPSFAVTPGVPIEIEIEVRNTSGVVLEWYWGDTLATYGGAGNRISPNSGYTVHRYTVTPTTGTTRVRLGCRSGVAGAAWDLRRISIKELSVADMTAPTLSGASAGTLTTTAAPLSVVTNEGTGTLYAVEVASGSPAPSAAQVVTGQDSTGAAALVAASQLVTASGAQALTLTTTESASPRSRVAYLVHADSAGNRSAVASVAYTRPATAAPTYTVGSRTYQDPAQPGAGITRVQFDFALTMLGSLGTAGAWHKLLTQESTGCDFGWLVGGAGTSAAWNMVLEDGTGLQLRTGPISGAPAVPALGTRIVGSLDVDYATGPGTLMINGVSTPITFTAPTTVQVQPTRPFALFGTTAGANRLPADVALEYAELRLNGTLRKRIDAANADTEPLSTAGGWRRLW